MKITEYLRTLVEQEGSDLFISANASPSIKAHGEIVPISSESLTEEDTLNIVYGAMNDKQRAEFDDTRECNYALAIDDVGRFRISAFWQRNMAGLVARRIETEIPEMDALKLPAVLKDVIMSKRGLVIMVGATGTGKSTSLAAMIGYRNRHSKGHILTVEDPIEFVHEHRKSIVNQREVGVDTESFEAGLKSALRQAPDVVLLGEIRSRETMEYALTFAETGHLCVATLHANNANQALERIMHLVPKEKHQQLLFDLSLNLRGIVAQQLVPVKNGKGRRAAIEVMLNSARVSDLIAKGELHSLKETMSKSNELGMQTFDQALFNLYQQGEISYADALHHADSPNDLRLMIKLQGGKDIDVGLLDDVTLDLD
ncbi:PilT/PilU family type 4a pilus ATPase [Psychrobium sp. 1_MG-2023]|uniref:PilT/PilU family type 4a pilus ATPase n=1 Tax=Psychrobium sp. 1_MG-2023 TaxID=3062624 RepID=UPI000C32F48D|nr:PilT/PilU family type 4a pilus ATPase [Psychrobium sp. 1_MG-2023]MDP2562374.1 PilT/PilU family type 4a pilus ATPase [Psychrobium sp. 1_MG-2023]PKF55860.1 type IV pili twitching motility protein PilT [Alteromonadales bacterium alter-6D02]